MAKKGIVESAIADNEISGVAIMNRQRESYSQLAEYSQAVMQRRYYESYAAAIEAMAMQPVSPWVSTPRAALTPPVEPTTALLDAPDTSQQEFLTDYQRLAKKIGYHCTEAVRELAETELVAYLHEAGMPVYDYAAVTKYMDGVVAKLNEDDGPGWQRRTHAWRWTGLRRCDIAAESTGLSPYTKAIPMPVLLTVEKLVDTFGERVRIEVSDIYTMARPDPFLAVSAPGSERKFVIERWDEPKFRG